MQITSDFALQGDAVEFTNADALRAEGCALIHAQADDIVVDLQALARANTVTVAVLLAWYREAQLQQKSIVFVNLSSELRNIIDFSGLDEVLLATERSPAP